MAMSPDKFTEEAVWNVLATAAEELQSLGVIADKFPSGLVLVALEPAASDDWVTTEGVSETVNWNLKITGAQLVSMATSDDEPIRDDHA